MVRIAISLLSVLAAFLVGCRPGDAASAVIGTPPVAPAQPTAAVTVTPHVRPTTVPTQPPAQRVGRTGETVVASGIALTVNAVRRLAQVPGQGGFTLKAPDGQEYIVVDVSIENVATDQSAPYNPFYFKLRDGGGYEYSSSITLDPQALKAGELRPGDRVRGTVAFAVPQGAGGLLLTYRPLVLTGRYETIRVSLE